MQDAPGSRDGPRGWSGSRGPAAPGGVSGPSPGPHTRTPRAGPGLPGERSGHSGARSGSAPSAAALPSFSPPPPPPCHPPSPAYLRGSARLRARPVTTLRRRRRRGGPAAQPPALPAPGSHRLGSLGSAGLAPPGLGRAREAIPAPPRLLRGHRAVQPPPPPAPGSGCTSGDAPRPLCRVWRCHEGRGQAEVLRGMEPPLPPGKAGRIGIATNSVSVEVNGNALPGGSTWRLPTPREHLLTCNLRTAPTSSPVSLGEPAPPNASSNSSAPCASGICVFSLVLSFVPECIYAPQHAPFTSN
ncbi:basic proline-rich protein-like [Myiozetetes cayanensis]|uniref:basic proline-rich protein-like n=1 Tax=Myiozetetes cayanensis TaxID=478635 RepID=UPI0021603F7A|nr:basic proline-rich protein-like [Myiozetetes cayanensis]